MPDERRDHTSVVFPEQGGDPLEQAFDNGLAG